jgi:hypothetical protein
MEQRRLARADGRRVRGETEIAVQRVLEDVRQIIPS